MDDRGHDKTDHKTELIIFPDGTSVELFVFANRCERSTAANPNTMAVSDASSLGSLTVCPYCGCDLVHPADWRRTAPGSWDIVLRCPDCESRRKVTLQRPAVERLNRELYMGAQILADEAARMNHRSFQAEAESFVDALVRDLILPMDF